MTMVIFVLDNQKRSTLFEQSDLEKLTNYVSSSVSVNRSWMDTTAAEEIKLRILEVIENTSSEDIKKTYNHLIESM